MKNYNREHSGQYERAVDYIQNKVKWDDPWTRRRRKKIFEQKSIA